jgi:hypothetical protein
METCEQTAASQVAFDNLLKRIPGLPEAVEMVDHNLPPPELELTEPITGLGRLAIVRETAKLARPLRPTTEPSHRLWAARQNVIDLAIAAEDITDIERLALLLSCRDEEPVADQFRNHHEAWTRLNEALQPGVAVALLGHNLGHNQPDYFYRVGQAGGLQVSVTTNNHAVPKVRVTTSQAGGLKISPESYGCYTVSPMDKSASRTIKKFPLGRYQTTRLAADNDSYEPPILGNNIADEDLFLVGHSPALLTARAVAARHLGLSQSAPPGINIGLSQPAVTEALVIAISSRLIGRKKFDPEPTTYQFKPDEGQDNAVTINFIEAQATILAIVASLFKIGRQPVENLMQAELAAVTYATARRIGEAGIYRSMGSHDYRDKQLRDLLAKIFPAA